MELKKKQTLKGRWQLFKFLVYIPCFCSSQVLCDDYGESGNKITLTPIIRGKPEEILWTHNGNKVLEYDGRELVKYGSYKDRVDVDFETGQLTIRKLNSQDSGNYVSEIGINRKIQTTNHTLTVLDALPEPLVTCEVDETSHLKKLSCSVESQTQPSYEWSGPDIKQPGPTLLVDEQEEKQDSVYTCTVKNKAASRTRDFTLQDCHTGGVNPAVLVPVLIVAVLLITLLAVLALYFYRRKRQKWESEREKNYPENGECDNLLINVPTETMPGSSDATLPCHTDEAEEKANSEPDKTDRQIESHKTSQTQEEMEKEKSQILKNERENKGELSEEQTETQREQNKNENADKNEDDQTPEDKKKRRKRKMKR
ncbi:SLAM family member 5-like isoform X2 [Labeo rohita]|uniref:SLAM family member 5-like isoform X2 n=1 Tax=Labeo rohita TaxID=84645 RepID=UPI0021E33B55|nr:SLAM family member 5-like isoform X2 [Labeo rohita]